MHPRGILPVLLARCAHRRVTVLTGARQTGKTTLVRELLPAATGLPPVYFSLDDPDERLRLAADPVRRLDHGPRLVVLDEIQKAPDLLDAVKLLADSGKGRRFLLLGSSQILLLSKVRETLAGRAALLELWPLSLAERAAEGELPISGLDLAWRHGSRGILRLAEYPRRVEEERRLRAIDEDHLRWGGYPALGQLPETERTPWLRDFRRTYLERDLADLGRVDDLDNFAMAQNLLAARTAQLLSYSEVSRELGVAVNTVKKYVRFLELSYQAVLVRPLHTNLISRLVKSPKLFMTDPGLARLLTERSSPEDGAIFETAVLDELLRWASWQVEAPTIRFFRSHSGAEVDFIVMDSERLIAIEVKASRTSNRSDTRRVRGFLDAWRASGGQAPRWKLGLLVNRGRDTFQLDSDIWAVPDWSLFGPVEPGRV